MMDEGIRICYPHETQKRQNDGGWDIAINGEEIYMIRQSPIQWPSGSTLWFGYDCVDPASPTEIWQETVIAKYEPGTINLTDGVAGWGWRYISQGIDDLIDGAQDVNVRANSPIHVRLIGSHFSHPTDLDSPSFLG